MTARAIGALTGRDFTPSNRAVTPPWLQSNLSDLVIDAPVPVGPSSQFSSDRLLAGTKALGATDRPDLQPQTTGEKYLAAGAQGVGSMLPLAPLAAGGALGNLARAGVQGLGAGLGGEAAAQALPEHPELARLGGNLAGALTAGGAFGLANRAVGAAQGNSTPTLQAYRDLNITPSLAGDVIGSPNAQMAQSYAARSPGGAGRVRAAREQAVNEFGQALDITAANYGTSRTLQQAGDKLQAGANKWLTDWRDAISGRGTMWTCTFRRTRRRRRQITRRPLARSAARYLISRKRRAHCSRR